MGYRVFFKNNLSTLISEDDYVQLIKAGNSGTVSADNLVIVSENKLINLNFIAMIERENVVENADSGVITPPTPQEIKSEKKKEHEKIVSSSDLLLSRIKENAEKDE